MCRVVRCRSAAIVAATLLLRFSGLAVTAADDAEEPPASAHEPPTEINRKVTNPVSLTWSLKLKNTVDLDEVGSFGIHPKYTLQFQPTMPLLVTPYLKLITRPEFTLVDDTAYVNGEGELQRTTGVGDTILDVVLSPRLGPWLLALGPTFVFPTANLDQTGQGKWQAGPAGVLGYQTKKWIADVIFQQWFSVGGDPDRSAVSELHVQYIASYFFGDGWSIGTSPTLKVNWRAAAGDRVTFPIGPTIGKVVKFGAALAVKFELEGLYVPVYPDQNGERWSVQFNIIPIVPALREGPLYDGS